MADYLIGFKEFSFSAYLSHPFPRSIYLYHLSLVKGTVLVGADISQLAGDAAGGTDGFVDVSFIS